jgi:large subunit ribosomal protein L3
MLKAILGKKLNMTQIFDRHGRLVPATVIKAGPVTIFQVKNKEKDGYVSAQVGFGLRKKPKKTLVAHLKNAKAKEAPRYLREVSFSGDLKVGDVITAKDLFRRGDVVDVVGTSKGKGFAGVVKRHGFAGGPRTHGQSDRLRAPGAIGATTTPGRVFKGIRMAGRMGGEKVTVQGLEIVDIKPEENLIVVKGAVPGPANGLLVVRRSRKKRKSYHEPEIPAAPHVGGGEEEKKETQVEAESAGTEEPKAVEEKEEDYAKKED